MTAPIGLEECERLCLGLLTTDDAAVKEHVTSWIRDNIATLDDLWFTVSFCCNLAGTFVSKALEVDWRDEFVGMEMSRVPESEREHIGMVVTQIRVAATNQDSQMTIALIDAALRPTDIEVGMTEADEERHAQILVTAILQFRAIMIVSIKKAADDAEH